MSSPRKPDSPHGLKLSTRPFIRRPSSHQHPSISELQQQIHDLQLQLEAKTQEADSANARAEEAKHREKKVKELAKRFWDEEWRSMREYMLAFSAREDVEEIEERILGEYGGLFGRGGDGGE
ncbi:hypothetical protein CC78DRAFT_568507 [Lojkania enalia]|uniref:Uncharacterized protein n=1 Tax=Lojkania enalia TaxID=147567 RepID=A0A9P4K7F9_9PLEO|nr:hypothetical protein CC78DRAFT_568507 [Didymosphaeria enalia]